MFIHTLIFYQNNFKRLEKHIKWADGAIVMYSITSRDTFEAALAILDHVIENLREHARFTPFMLVGNKTDLERYRYLDKSYIII